jgi:hypothetical protein
MHAPRYADHHLVMVLDNAVLLRRIWLRLVSLDVGGREVGGESVGGEFAAGVYAQLAAGLNLCFGLELHERCRGLIL